MILFRFRPPVTAICPHSDHLGKSSPTRIAGRCGPAGGRSATTCLYPALFSTPRFTSPAGRIRLLRPVFQSPATKPQRGLSGARRGTDATPARKRPHGAAQAATAGEPLFPVQTKPGQPLTAAPVPGGAVTTPLLPPARYSRLCVGSPDLPG